MTLEQDKKATEKRIAAMIQSVCKRHKVVLLDLAAGKVPDYQNSGAMTDGSVHLVLGVR